MSNLDRRKLRRLILREIQKMKEDSLRPMHDDPGRQSYVAAKGHYCYECGYGMKEGETTCEQCGSMREEEQLNEGDCGCHSINEGHGCGDEYEDGDYEILNYDSNYDFIPDHMENHHDDDIMEPGEAFGLGVKIGNHGHYKGAYMAKKQMYKVAKYAEKLYHMIPDGHNLEDWMRTKLAQIADDIGEVYHALDHDIYEGDM